MKTTVFLFLFFLSFSLQAQKKNRSLHLFANGLFAENTKGGMGFGMKFLSGHNGKEFLSVQASFNLFALKSVNGVNGGNKRTFPLMIGYHRRFGNFYVEPQIGYGVYAARITAPDFALPSQGAFFGAMETGYIFNRLSIHIRYESAFTAKNSWLGSPFAYGVAGIAYNLSSSESNW